LPVNEVILFKTALGICYARAFLAVCKKNIMCKYYLVYKEIISK